LRADDHAEVTLLDSAIIGSWRRTADPRVVIHLESAEDVLIVRGVVEDLGPPAAVPRVVAALAAASRRRWTALS
jgi:hypothetical protein